MITFLHTSVFIALNANEEKAIARFEMLMEKSLWTSDAVLMGTTDLIHHYLQKMETAKTKPEVDEIDDRVIGLWRHVIEKYPNDSRGYWYLSGYYQQLHLPEKELYYLQLATGARTNILFNAIDRLGQTYLERMLPDSAIAMWKRSMTLFPNQPVAYMDIGIAYRMKQDFITAVSYLEKSRTLDSTNVDVYLNLGFVYQALKNYPLAVYHWRRFIQLAPNDKNVPYIKTELEKLRSLL
jgi:tetratricopeptide (TPR) repeat protein